MYLVTNYYNDGTTQSGYYVTDNKERIEAFLELKDERLVKRTWRKLHENL